MEGSEHTLKCEQEIVVPDYADLIVCHVGLKEWHGSSIHTK